MFHVQLLESFRLLDPEEWKLFDRFVHSRLFYYSENASGVIALFDLLKPFAPDFSTEAALSKENIAQLLGQTPQHVSKTASGLYAVLKKFINWNTHTDYYSDFYENLSLLKFYSKHQLVQRFEALYAKTLDRLEQSSTQKHADYLKKKYQLDLLKCDWQDNYLFQKDNNLRTTINSLEAYFLSIKIKLSFSLLIREQNFQSGAAEFQYPLDEVAQFFLDNPTENYPLMYLYAEAIKILLSKPDADFDAFLTRLQQWEEKLDYEDINNLYSVERQVLLQKYRQNQDGLPRELFELYKKHWDKNLLWQRGQILPATFANVVRYACRCSEFEWASSFLVQTENKIGGINESKDLHRLYTAYYYLYKGQINEAEKHLAADFEDAIRKVDARCMELMVYFLQKSPVLEHKIDTFRKLVRNTSGLPDIRQVGFHNFALTLRKMINPDLKYNDKKIDALITAIRSEPTSELFWLIEQLNKLKRLRGRQ
jgi:hypothetical protein